MAESITRLLTENYGAFVDEHRELFEDVETAANIIIDDTYYDMYVTKLLENLDESTAIKMRKLLDRERKMYLDESSVLLSSPEAISYAVASFPMLINIYADPMLSKAVTIHPYDKPVMSINRLRWVAKVIDETGATKEYLFPTATKMIRPEYKIISVGQADNLFAVMNVQKGDFRISKRNFRVASLTADVNGTITDIPLNAAADARGNVNYTFVVDADPANPGADVGEYKLQAQIDFESGDVTWAVVPINPATNPVTFQTAAVKFRMFGNGNGRQVVKSEPRNDIIDINADIEDSFEVENLEEVIQDWKSLYDINILAELKNHVKDQIKLNRDFEIAEILEANLDYIQTLGQVVEVDFSSFADGGTAGLRPVTIQDIFQNFVPALNALIERMRRQNNMEVQYLVCGVDTAAILKSLQEFAVRFEGLTGQTGFSGTVGAFGKLEIIESYAVRPDLVHLVTEAPTLGQSSIVMVMYKPLYIITETTNSIRRTFIKSRTWLGIVRPEGLGAIVFKNYSAYFGSYDPYMP